MVKNTDTKKNKKEILYFLLAGTPFILLLIGFFIFTDNVISSLPPYTTLSYKFEIDCTDMEENKEYPITVKLLDKNTREIIRDKNGNEINIRRKFYLKDLNIHEVKKSDGTVRKVAAIETQLDVSNIDWKKYNYGKDMIYSIED